MMDDHLVAKSVATVKLGGGVVAIWCADNLSLAVQMNKILSYGHVAKVSLDDYSDFIIIIYIAAPSDPPFTKSLSCSSTT